MMHRRKQNGRYSVATPRCHALNLKRRCLALKLCCFLSDSFLPGLSLLFVGGYWALGLYFYYTWPDMKELCVQ